MTDRAGNWILMRGLTRECRHWGGFTELLAQSLPHSSIQCIDLPGNGALCNESSPDEIADITDRVRAQSGESSDVHLLGLSMGGMVACDWALRYPEEVQGVVLINSSLADLSPVWQRIRWQVWWSVLCAFLAPRETAGKHDLPPHLQCAGGSRIHATAVVALPKRVPGAAAKFPLSTPGGSPLPSTGQRQSAHPGGVDSGLGGGPSGRPGVFRTPGISFWQSGAPAPRCWA